mmetsp:Transcript_52059/g.97708  ORF Transcript_52059/g.97708 Transcript_52059/m.97708 type:complete len:276 (+) Transcript_52059:110-937(+)
MALDSLMGRSVAELLEEYAAPISALRAQLGETDTSEDDLMLMRFLIQEGGNVEVATQRAKEGRELRVKHAAVLEKARVGEHLPQEAVIRKFLCYGRWAYPNSEFEKECPPLIITRSGKSNGQALMQAVTVEELAEYFIWERRRCFDDVTRKCSEKGRLEMLITVNDLEGASLVTGREPKFFQAVKEASEAGASLFPLLSRKHVMVNSGRAIEVLFKLASSFMPQRVLNKVAFMTCDELVEACGIPRTGFPDFIGGTCSLPADSPLASGFDGVVSI